MKWISPIPILLVTGQPADFERQLRYGHDRDIADSPLVPFGSPYAPPQEFGSPYTIPHAPFGAPQPLPPPAGFAPPYNLHEEEANAEPFHQAGSEHGYVVQHGHQAQPPHTLFGNPSNPAPTFAPGYPPPHSAEAGRDSQQSYYDQLLLPGGGIDNCNSSAGQKRNFESLYEKGPCRDSPAPQPAYAPSSPAYAPSSPHAVPAEFSKPGDGQAAGNQAMGLSLQGHPADALNHPIAQARS